MASGQRKRLCHRVKDTLTFLMGLLRNVGQLVECEMLIWIVRPINFFKNYTKTGTLKYVAYKTVDLKEFASMKVRIDSEEDMLHTRSATLLAIKLQSNRAKMGDEHHQGQPHTPLTVTSIRTFCNKISQPDQL